jgi:hypothetical protein
MPRSGLLTGVVIGVVGTWAFHKYVRPMKGKS